MEKIPQKANREKLIEELDSFVGFSIKKYVEVHYSDLPYHNFDHALDIVEQSRELVRRCRKYDVNIDESVVVLAALFHDAGYDHSFDENDFSSKEEYSAHIAETELSKLNLDKNLIQKVKECIMATHRDAPFISVEQKVLRSADLSSMASSYQIFLENNQKLKKEYELLNGVSISMDEWKKLSKSLIEFYLRQDIRLTPEHDDIGGQSIFHRRVRENLERFLNSH